VIDCPIGCGVKLKRSELADHQKSLCANTIIVCPFESLGCSSTRMPRSSLPEHDAANGALHLRLMGKLVNEVSELRKQVAVSASSVSSPKSPIASSSTAVATAAAPAPPQIYIFGGHCGDKKVVHTSERWTSGKWETLPPMPTARKLVQAAKVGDFIYVVGKQMECYLSS
jgi:hypothetical protein